MIRLTARTAIPDQAIRMQFIRSAGPGGQNVNKVATGVQLWLELDAAELPAALRQRLERLAGNRLTRDGSILIEAQRFRTQERNRADAMARLQTLVAQAEHVPKKRLPTRPSASARRRRTDAKSRRGARKRLRGKPAVD